MSEDSGEQLFRRIWAILRRSDQRAQTELTTAPLTTPEPERQDPQPPVAPAAPEAPAPREDDWREQPAPGESTERKLMALVAYSVLADVRQLAAEAQAKAQAEPNSQRRVGELDAYRKMESLLERYFDRAVELAGEGGQAPEVGPRHERAATATTTLSEFPGKDARAAAEISRGATRDARERAEEQTQQSDRDGRGASRGIGRPRRYLDRWIEERSWELHSWRDRDGATWAALAPKTETLELLRDATCVPSAAGFREALQAAAVLPVRSGSSLSSALDALEARLAQLPEVEHARGSGWGARVESLYKQVEHQARQQLLDTPALRGLAQRLETRFGVPCTPLPPGTHSGELVELVRFERGGSAAALRTQDGLHIFIATQRDLARLRGRAIDVQARPDGIAVTQDLSRGARGTRKATHEIFERQFKKPVLPVPPGDVKGRMVALLTGADPGHMRAVVEADNALHIIRVAFDRGRQMLGFDVAVRNERGAVSLTGLAPPLLGRGQGARLQRAPQAGPDFTR